ncbi:MAG: guanylate kinase [Candidatus Moranbacteria bacterium]|nr:guanylate kinase [Candidatus Moranbacteria bacterium]
MKNVFIISGPSGSGQDSIIENLALELPLKRVITTTTRPKRSTESEGNPYHFVSLETFDAMRQENLFLECAQTYNGEWYGVTKKELLETTSNHKIVIWKVDHKGVAKIKSLFPEIIAFFIEVPPEILRKRLEARDNPSSAYLEDRMRYTEDWQVNRHLYDYCIKNENGKLKEAVHQIKEIIQKNLS